MNPSIKMYPLEKLILMGIDKIGFKSYITNKVIMYSIGDICRYADDSITNLSEFEIFYSVKVKCFWLKGGEEDAETDNENRTGTCIK